MKKERLTIDNRIRFKKRGNFETDLYNILNSISDDNLFNFEHKLSKPSTIYKKAKERVIEACEDFFVELNTISNKDLDKVEWRKIDKAHAELLDSIIAFTDDGFNILKCFYSKSDEVREEK